MKPLWQLFDESGNALEGKGVLWSDAYSQGILHGAAHVWIWRQGTKEPEVMVQKRANDKVTWPGRLDVSAAGHIDLGETPLDAALREAKEEIGLDVPPDSLSPIDVYRAHYKIPDEDVIENEFQWLYVHQFDTRIEDLQLESAEVSDILWRPFSQFRKEVYDRSGPYIPHDTAYYDTVIAGLEAAIKN